MMSRTQRSLLLRTLLFLFGVNAVLLAVYFLLHLRHPDTLPINPNRSPPPPPLGSLKPWPSLPSFLPWSLSPAPPPRSCEAYFGHGFSRRIDLLPSSSSFAEATDGDRDRDLSGRGWFRCFYSETLQSSICEGGKVRMDPGRIRMSSGGEALEAVMGRDEDAELPKYEDGAFQIEGEEEGSVHKERVVDKEFLDQYVSHGEIHFHTMRALMESMQIVPRGELNCTQWVDEPTVLVTRFEYANLFHTITDWYSAYVSSRVTKLQYRPNLVFVDGHCKTQLEEMWEALFSSVRYAKTFSSPVCFNHVILAPLGYETALFKGLTNKFSCRGTFVQNLREEPDNQRTARLSEFGEMLRSAHGLLGNDDLPAKTSAGYNVLFVRREDYLAHPRHSGKIESRLSNEQEVFDAIEKWAVRQKKCKINVVNGLFAHMPMKEQLRAIQEASVVIGAHGAGLTHLVAATPDTKVLEIISSFYIRFHFALISEWKGLEYHPIYLSDSYAKPATVIEELSSIMGSLGC